MKAQKAPKPRYVFFAWACMLLTATLLTPEMASADFFDNIGTLTCKVASTVTGPIAAALVIIAIASFGFLVAFTEAGPLVKGISGVLLGGCIALSAPAIIQTITNIDVSSRCSGMLR